MSGHEKNLFLSYGHDEHSPFARRLKADLEKNGYRVWFDEDCLKAGVEWEIYLDSGLERVSAEKGKLVLLMTPHSVRRPDGYCLNELARVYARGIPIVPVMAATVEPPLAIARIQWLDCRDCVPAEQHEEKYAARFEKLVDAIEHDRLVGEGTQARLRSFLTPIDYDEPAHHLQRFTGREWVKKEVDLWLSGGRRRVLWITGEAGTGKTALAAWLCERHPEICGVHYFRYNHSDRTARNGLLSLAWQLSTQLPDYESRLNAADLEGIRAETNLAGLFDRLFVAPFTSGFPLPGRGIVLLIDALDEATENGANELASLIGTEWNRTPEWLRLIVTSRPHEAEINTELQSLDPWVLAAARDESYEDIRMYLRRELRPFVANVGVDDALLNTILGKSEGLFLYVSWMREELEAGRLSLANLGAFPRGLGGMYQASFRRYFPDTHEYKQRWRPIIEVICTSRQPLSLEDLGTMFPDFYDPSEITLGLGSLFPDSGSGLRPFHQSLRDWVTNRDLAGPIYVVRTDLGHMRLAEEGWRQYRNNSELPVDKRMRTYFLVHAPAHLSISARKSDLAKLLLDPEWMMPKLKMTDVNALVADFEYLKPSPEAELLQGALRLSANVLAADPGQFASQMVGRLLPYLESPTVARFVADLCVRSVQPWLRPLHPALHPPGTELVRTLEGHSSAVYGVALTTDGRWAVSASVDETLRVWDLETGRALRTLKGHSSSIWGVAVTADGRRAVSASEDQTLIVWDLETGQPLRILKGHEAPVRGVAVTADGKRAISASWDKTLRVWDLETSWALHTLEGHSHAVHNVAVTADGKRAVSASGDKTFRVWDLETGCVLRTLEGHSASIWSVAVTTDGKRAVSASWDKTLIVWDLETGCALRILKGHEAPVRGVAVTADGKRAVSASGDRTLRVWDLENRQALRTLAGHSDFVHGVAVTADGKRAVSASGDRTLRVWDLETGRALSMLERHSHAVHSIAVTADGKRAVSASDDQTLKVWDLETGLALRTLEGHSHSMPPQDPLQLPQGYARLASALEATFAGAASAVAGVAVTADGKRAVSASDDQTLKVWDLETGQELRTLKGHSSSIWGVAVTADGKRAVSASYDQTLKVWDLENGQALRTLEGHSAPVRGVAVTADGKRAVSVSDDKTLKVWDLESGQQLRTLEGHSNSVRSIAVAADGKRAVSGSWDKTLKVWDLESGQQLRTLEGHEAFVEGVAVTADGKRAVSASNKTLQLWDLESCLALATFTCDAALVCCAFANAEKIVAGDAGGRLHFLMIDEGPRGDTRKTAYVEP